MPRRRGKQGGKTWGGDRPERTSGRAKTPGLIDTGGTNEHRGREGAIAAQAVGFARS